MTEYALTDADGTVRWRGTIDPPPGGGSQTQKTVSVPFAFDTPELVVTGIEIYTPELNETLLAWSRVTITTAFDGTPAPVFHVYSQGTDPNSDALCSGTIDGVGPDGPSADWRLPALVFSNNDNGSVPFDSGLVALTTTPIMAMLDNGSGGDPGSTHGVGEIVLVLLAAPA